MSYTNTNGPISDSITAVGHITIDRKHRKQKGKENMAFEQSKIVQLSNMNMTSEHTANKWTKSSDKQSGKGEGHAKKWIQKEALVVMLTSMT